MEMYEISTNADTDVYQEIDVEPAQEPIRYNLTSDEINTFWEHEKKKLEWKEEQQSNVPEHEQKVLHDGIEQEDINQDSDVYSRIKNFIKLDKIDFTNYAKDLKNYEQYVEEQLKKVKDKLIKYLHQLNNPQTVLCQMTKDLNEKFDNLTQISNEIIQTLNTTTFNDTIEVLENFNNDLCVEIDILDKKNDILQKIIPHILQKIIPQLNETIATTDKENSTIDYTLTLDDGLHAVIYKLNKVDRAFNKKLKTVSEKLNKQKQEQTPLDTELIELDKQITLIETRKKLNNTNERLRKTIETLENTIKELYKNIDKLFPLRNTIENASSFKNFLETKNLKETIDKFRDISLTWYNQQYKFTPTPTITIELDIYHTIMQYQILILFKYIEETAMIIDDIEQEKTNIYDTFTNNIDNKYEIYFDNDKYLNLEEITRDLTNFLNTVDQNKLLHSLTIWDKLCTMSNIEYSTDKYQESFNHTFSLFLSFNEFVQFSLDLHNEIILNNIIFANNLYNFCCMLKTMSSFVYTLQNNSTNLLQLIGINFKKLVKEIKDIINNTSATSPYEQEIKSVIDKINLPNNDNKTIKNIIEATKMDISKNLKLVVDKMIQFHGFDVFDTQVNIEEQVNIIFKKHIIISLVQKIKSDLLQLNKYAYNDIFNNTKIYFKLIHIKSVPILLFLDKRWTQFHTNMNLAWKKHRNSEYFQTLKAFLDSNDMKQINNLFAKKQKKLCKEQIKECIKKIKEKDRNHAWTHVQHSSFNLFRNIYNCKRNHEKI